MLGVARYTPWPVMLFGLGLLAGLVFVFDLLIDGVVFDLLSCHISR